MVNDNNTKIRIENVSVMVGQIYLLKDININIPRNKLTVLLGPSGCGKTTLLKTMNRLTDMYPEMKVTGNIYINEQEILHSNIDITELRRRMGLLSQRPYPLPMSIYRNIAFGLRLSGRRKKNILAKRIEHHLKQASLWDEVKDRLHDPASGLSIGQQQRMCLARGLAVDPDIILADEPTSALDPVSSQQIEQKFCELKKSYTIVMVTHSIHQARRIADHVVFLYNGEVIEQDSAEVFFKSPKSDIAKAFQQGLFE